MQTKEYAHQPQTGTLELAPVLGFQIGGALPRRRLDVDIEQRVRAALYIVGLTRSYSPEELHDHIPAAITAAFADELERDEALAHVDGLLDILIPLSHGVSTDSPS